MIPDRFEGHKREVPPNSEDKLSPSGDHVADADSPDLDDFAGGTSLGSVDSFVWQRLVDDRLDEEQYRELLVTMESKPALWRECALAFLEEQALRKSLAELRRGLGTSPSAVTKSEAKPTERSTIGVRTDVVVSQLPEPAGSMNRNGGAWRFAVPIFAAAAGFLLTLYSFSGMLQNPGTNVANDGNGSDVSSAPVVRELAEFKDYLADLSVEQRRELFQLSSESSVGTPIQAQPVSLSPNRLNGKRRFLFYRTIDGGQIVIPVDDYQYVTHDFQ